MKERFQLGRWLCGLGLGLALVVPGASAQSRPSSDRPSGRQQAPPTRSDRSSGSYHPQNRPQDRTQGRAPAPRVGAPRTQGAERGSNRQPAYPDPRQPSSADRGRANDRPQSSYKQQTPAAPPPNVQERLRNMS